MILSEGLQVLNTGDSKKISNHKLSNSACFLLFTDEVFQKEDNQFSSGGFFS